MEGLRQSNKGFTLVEICVVLVLFSILATTTTLGLIGWQHESTYRTQEDNAEMIYMAARNKIAQLRANNVLGDFSGWGSKGSNNTVTIISESTSQNYYYALASKGDYQNYNSGSMNDPDKQKSSLVFELINDYIADKGILNGNIAILYDEDGTIYTVYFSDRTEISFSGADGLDKKENREYTKLYDNMIGVYSCE